jgi:hypothetical protein
MGGQAASISDSRLMNWALDEGKTLSIPRGTFLLADKGFDERYGLLLPYRGQRDNLRD